MDFVDIRHPLTGGTALVPAVSLPTWLGRGWESYTPPAPRDKSDTNDLDDDQHVEHSTSLTDASTQGSHNSKES